MLLGITPAPPHAVSHMATHINQRALCSHKPPIVLQDHRLSSDTCLVGRSGIPWEGSYLLIVHVPVACLHLQVQQHQTLHTVTSVMMDAS